MREEEEQRREKRGGSGILTLRKYRTHSPPVTQAFSLPLKHSRPVPQGLCTCCCCIYILNGPLLLKVIHSERLSLIIIKIPHPALPSPLTLLYFSSLYLSFETKVLIYLCTCFLCVPPTRPFLVAIYHELPSR